MLSSPVYPPAASLSEVGSEAQAELMALVASVGGRYGLKPTPAIPVGDLEVLVKMIEEWVDH